VTVAGGRREVVEPADLLGGQLVVVGGGVLLDPGDPLGAGKPWPSGEKATKPMPSSRVTGSTAASGSRVQREYSDWSAASGWTAWARRIVTGPA